MKMTFARIVLPVIGFGFFLSCSKGPGTGGSSTIRGKIYDTVTNTLGQHVDSGYAMKEDVYIVYGTDVFYANKTSTGDDGTYEFPYLKKGNYTIYAYSKCYTCPNQKESIRISVDIAKNHTVVVAPQINILK